MRGRAFFDTNVLVYVLSEDPVRTPKAEEVVARGGVISVQVLNELSSTASRKLGLSWPEIQTALAALRELLPNVISLDIATHERAVELASRYGFAFYDALIASSALMVNCSTLLTEDFQDGQMIEGSLRVVNPFR